MLFKTIFLLLEIEETTFFHACPNRPLGQDNWSDQVWKGLFDSTDNTPDNLLANGLSTVNCCNGDGDCVRKFTATGDCFPYDATHAEAEAICESEARRLCRLDEIVAGNCCDKGCGFNRNYGWVERSNTNYCDSDPCQNGGTCYENSAEHYCLCSAGFSGTQCEITEITEVTVSIFWPIRHQFLSSC